MVDMLSLFVTLCRRRQDGKKQLQEGKLLTYSSNQQFLFCQGWRWGDVCYLVVLGCPIGIYISKAHEAQLEAISRDQMKNLKQYVFKCSTEDANYVSRSQTPPVLPALNGDVNSKFWTLRRLYTPRHNISSTNSQQHKPLTLLKARLWNLNLTVQATFIWLPVQAETTAYQAASEIR